MSNPISGGRLVQFGEFRLHLQSGELEQNGSRLILAEQPFRLLAILIRERGALVTRDALRRELWPDGTFVDFEASLNAVVKRVREVLGDSPAAPRFIETLPKRGYRFIAPVQNITEQAEIPDASLEFHPPLSAGAARDVPAPARSAGIGGFTGSHRRWAGIVLTIGIVAMAPLIMRMIGPRPGSPEATPAVERVTNDGTVLLAAISLDGRDIAYVRRDGVRESLWLKRENHSAPDRLLDPGDGSFRSLTFASRDLLHYSLFRPDKTPVRPFSLSTSGGSPRPLLEPAGRITVSRDGSLCAYISSFSLLLRESRVVVSDLAGREARVISVRRPPHSFMLTKPAWSPDGSRLVVFGISETAPTSPELLVIDVATGRVSQASRIALSAVDGALWLPDGAHVVVSGRQRSATPQRLWLFSLASEALQPLTSDLSDYSLVGLSATRQVVAVRGDVARSVWTAKLNALHSPEEVAQNAGDLGELEGLAWLSDKEVLYSAADDGNVDIWSVSIDRRTRRRLTTDAADDFHPSVTRTGETVVFASTREGSAGIWRMGGDGTHQKRLTSGADIRPSISRDGAIVVFQRGAIDNTPFALWRLPLGDKPTQIAENHSMRPALSPDARSIAHYLMTSDAWMLAITPSAGGPPARTLPISETHAARVVRWSPDGRALAFIDGAGGASNIWLQPVAGGPAKKLTSFSEGRITTFDWSPGGSRLAWTRVHEVRDVVALDVPIGGPGQRAPGVGSLSAR